ncbi:MAG: TetR family transcriptional regulator [Solirubrobacteraceae bacterium]
MTPLQADAHARVEAAALSLFTQKGYAHTTVDDIVDGAGLARRTFFRHFANKREVLFWGHSTLQEAHAGAVAATPEGSSPLEMAAAALNAAADIMRPRKALIRQRQAVIAANVELQERELLKRSQLSHALAQALTARGVDPFAAAVTAEAALGAYGIAFRGWAEGRSEDLHTSVSAALDALRTLG